VTPAERLYRVLLRLYPPAHRREYRQPMLQLARDQGLDARRRGGWQVFVLCLRLLQDGLVNAVTEQMEAMMMAKTGMKPAPWWSVLLAILPGLLMLLSRSGVRQLDTPLLVLNYLYLALLLIGLPLVWRRQRQFPAWGLLPAGMLGWLGVFLAGKLLSEQGARLLPDESWLTLLQALLAVILLSVLLRGRRRLAAFWLVAAGILVFNLLMAAGYSREYFGSSPLLSGMMTYFTNNAMSPLEGFLLVGIGLLAVRQHGELALLVVAGGYSYMLMDSDYLFGSPERTWPGLMLYFMCLILIYLVVMPVAALRARSSLGRALAVFLPVALFHAARLIVPSLVLQHTIRLPLGEVPLSANVLLSLLLAWTVCRPQDGEPRPVGELIEAVH
jgi:hypothetical protein